MRTLTTFETNEISAGEFTHGEPTADMLCLNTRMMILAGRGEAGFDIASAVHSLVKYCNSDFYDPNVAHEFVMNGDIP